MGCHQTAGLSHRADPPEFSPNGAVLKLNPPAGRARARARARSGSEQSFRMMYYGRRIVVFSDTQLYSSDYSLQLSMSLQNFVAALRRDVSEGSRSGDLRSDLLNGRPRKEKRSAAF